MPLAGSPDADGSRGAQREHLQGGRVGGCQSGALAGRESYEFADLAPINADAQRGFRRKRPAGRADQPLQCVGARGKATEFDTSNGRVRNACLPCQGPLRQARMPTGIGQKSGRTHLPMIADMLSHETGCLQRQSTREDWRRCALS